MSAAAQALSPTTAEKPRLAEEVETEDLRWRPLLGLPCQLTVDLPLPKFQGCRFSRAAGRFGPRNGLPGCSRHPAAGQWNADRLGRI